MVVVGVLLLPVEGGVVVVGVLVLLVLVLVLLVVAVGVEVARATKGQKAR